MSTSADTQNQTRRTLSWWLAKLVTPGLVLLAGLMFIVGIGIAQRVGWIATDSGSGAVSGDASEPVHTCPMHPQIRQPGPGRCPICGMALVPAASESAGSDDFSVNIATAQRRLSNIETAIVKREPVFDSIRTVGAIAIDESRMATIASYFDGRIERIFADYTGVRVSQDDHLAVVYSPELFSAQVDYLQSLKALKTQATLEPVRRAKQQLVDNSRKKLAELGMREAQIGELESTGEAKSRQTIYSPTGGTVIEKLAVEGKYVKAGEPIYRIADLSMVWLMLELYPEDAARIRFGQRVQAEVRSLPGRSFVGRIAFVDPTVDPRKRTVGVRVEFRNEDRVLRPGDYAEASIGIAIGQTGDVYDAELAGKWISPMHPQIISDKPGKCSVCGMDLVPAARYGYSAGPTAQPESLHVPRSAILMAGNNSVAYVETEPGRFEIRVVRPGPILRDTVIILDGLKEGEQVATSGNFLIDSQMQLAGKPSLIDPTRALPENRARKEPLSFTSVNVETVGGAAGSKLESLFRAYFAVHKRLAADKKPAEGDATELHRLATELAMDPDLPTAARQQLDEVARHSEHLHHLELEAARHKSFRPVSHAVVKLAAIVRGSESGQEFQHMFCPMVKGGGGDWLQPDRDLLNPYWGSAMLTCGDIVRTFPLKASGSAAASQKSDPGAGANRD